MVWPKLKQGGGVKKSLARNRNFRDFIQLRQPQKHFKLQEQLGEGLELKKSWPILATNYLNVTVAYMNILVHLLKFGKYTQNKTLKHLPQNEKHWGKTKLKKPFPPNNNINK